MTTYVITYRGVKGSPITIAEYDGSLHNLNDRVTAQETLTADMASVVSASIDTNGHLHFTMSNSDDIDAGALPDPSTSLLADLYIGDWPPVTAVFKNQLFTAIGQLYIVLMDHVTASTFSAGANDGGGHDYYKLVVPRATIPNYDITDDLWEPAPEDANALYQFTNSDGCTITLNDLPWKSGTEMYFRQAAANTITVQAGSGVTISGVNGFLNSTACEGALITVKYVGTASWILFGFLARETTI